jgi:hypothetical protein
VTRPPARRTVTAASIAWAYFATFANAQPAHQRVADLAAIPIVITLTAIGGVTLVTTGSDTTTLGPAAPGFWSFRRY